MEISETKKSTAKFVSRSVHIILFFSQQSRKLSAGSIAEFVIFLAQVVIPTDFRKIECMNQMLWPGFELLALSIRSKVLVILPQR